MLFRSLLGAALEDVHQGDAAPDVQRTHALGAVELVAGEAQHINVLGLDVDGQVARRLHGVGVEQNALFPAHGADLPHMQEYVRKSRICVSELDEIIAQENRAMDKVQGLFADMKEREQAWQELKQFDSLELVGSLKYNIEINAAGVNKGKGLLELGEILGISSRDSYPAEHCRWCFCPPIHHPL